VQVPTVIFKNLDIFKRPPKKEGDPIFDRLTTASLNVYLNKLMPGLSAKVFRTFNASYTFQKELTNTPQEGSSGEKLLAYNRANRQVAILCNHQRSVSKTHDTSMTKLKDKVLAMKIKRVRLKRLIYDRYLKEQEEKRDELLKEESDLDEETIKRIDELEKQKEEEKNLKKQLQKQQQQSDTDKSEKMNGNTESQMRRESAIQVLAIDVDSAREDETDADADAEGSSSQRRSKSEREAPLPRLEKQLEMLILRIAAAKNQLIDRDENKTTALGTSKINYIDPRISVAWCKRSDVPLEKIFNKSLRDKFKWAMSVPSNWEF